MPLAGNYRLIDVPISNALNSGLMRIFVLTQFNSVSLHRHITATYKFSPFSRGFVEVLAAQQTPNSEGWFQGTADAVRQNLPFLTEQPGDKTLILSGDHLYRMDYDETHMDLVRPRPAFDFYDPEWRIYTRPRYLPGSPVRQSRLDRSIVASGCVIEDSDIEESIVGLRAIAYGATVRRTLLMGVDEGYPAIAGAPPVGIGRGSHIEKAIIDKNARIGRDVRLVNGKGVEDAEGDGWVIRDGIIVVPKNGVVRDGTVV